MSLSEFAHVDQSQLTGELLLVLCSVVCSAYGNGGVHHKFLSEKVSP